MRLTLACGRYDRTQPLIDGRVRPKGLELNFIPLKPGETFWRQLNHQEFNKWGRTPFSNPGLEDYLRAPAAD